MPDKKSCNSDEKYYKLNFQRSRKLFFCIKIYTKNVAVASNSSTKSKANELPKGDFNTYVVKSGDSLWTIAQKYANVSVSNIKEWNNIWSVKSLKPGTKLKIFSK